MRTRTGLAVIATAAALGTALPASAALWNWSYAGAGIQASGTFTTTDVADADGFYTITSISGTRNGVAITALYPTGSAIPGNEGYLLDNLVRLGDDGQLTSHGFGFVTAAGDYANPFYADFYTPAYYLEVFTTAAGDYYEPRITFSAELASVPEPGSLVLTLAGLGVLGWAARRGRSH